MITLFENARKIKKNMFEVNEYIIKISNTGKTATVYDYETLTKSKKRIFENQDKQKCIKFKGHNAIQYILLSWSEK